MEIRRRELFTILAGALAAPVVVRSGILMPVRPIDLSTSVIIEDPFSLWFRERSKLLWRYTWSDGDMSKLPDKLERAWVRNDGEKPLWLLSMFYEGSLERRFTHITMATQLELRIGSSGSEPMLPLPTDTVSGSILTVDASTGELVQKVGKNV